MKKIGLSLYGFHIEDFDSKETSLENLRGYNFVEIIKQFSSQYKENTYDTDMKSENIFTIISTNNKVKTNARGQVVYNFISGRVKTGDFGIVSELVDTTNGEIKKRNIQDAEVLPFSFGFLYAGGNVNYGIVAFQTEGRYGMKTNFIKRLKTFLNDNYTGIKLETRPIVPIQFVNNIMNKGILRKIKLLKYETPADTNQRLGANEGVIIKEERIFSNLVGVIERKRAAIIGFITGKNNIREIINLDDFNYDELRMEFNVGGRSKTLNFSNLDRIVITIDVEEEELIIKDGHPTHESIEQLIEQNAYDYLQAVRK